MKSPCIELGLGDEIECWSFICAIVKATHPTLEDAKGIDCVIGKLVNYSDSNGPFQLPFKVTDDDRAALEPLLEHLPELNGKMYDLEIETFLYLYSSLPDRLSWVPTLNNKANIDRIKYEQLDRQAWHREELQERLQCGEIQAFDSYHLPVKRIGPNVFIPREQAIAYLIECGIKIYDTDESQNLSKIEPTVIHQQDVNDSSENMKITASPLKTSSNSSHKGTQEQWTDAQLKIFLDHHETLAKKYNNATQRLAGEYKISTARIRQLLTKAKEKKAEKNSPFNGLGQRS